LINGYYGGEEGGNLELGKSWSKETISIIELFLPTLLAYLYALSNDFPLQFQ